MSQTTILEIPSDQQEWMLQELRAGRYGYLLARHLLLLCARGKTPSEVAEFRLCSGTSVYRAVEAWRSGTLAAQWWPEPTAELLISPPPAASRFSRLVAWLITRPPRAFGWCRTRWSCAALALEIVARTGLEYSRETVRRELHAQS